MENRDQHKEKALFLLIAQGDEAAFEELFHLYVPKIQPVIMKIVRSEAVSQDLIQDIFLNIWINRSRLEEIDAPSNWIYKIVYNRTYSWLEHQSVRERVHADIETKDRYMDDQVSFSETARLVQEAIHRLPPQTKRIYLLSRQENMKQQDIAALLGIAVSTVKNTMVNAGKSIRDYLAQHGILLPLILLVSGGFFLVSVY